MATERLCSSRLRSLRSLRSSFNILRNWVANCSATHCCSVAKFVLQAMCRRLLKVNGVRICENVMRECEILLYRRTGNERSTSKRETEHEHFQEPNRLLLCGCNVVHEQIGLTSALGRHIIKEAKRIIMDRQEKDEMGGKKKSTGGRGPKYCWRLTYKKVSRGE